MTRRLFLRRLIELKRTPESKSCFAELYILSKYSIRSNKDSTPVATIEKDSQLDDNIHRLTSLELIKYSAKLLILLRNDKDQSDLGREQV